MEAERRYVTVLFADMVGFTPFSERWGEEAAYSLMRSLSKAKVEHSNAKKIQDLVKVKSIGPEFATALVSEVFYRSFDNRKQLAGYLGLTPSHFQSGPMCRDQG